MLLTDSSCLFVSFYLWYSADILSSVLFACVVNQFLKPRFSNQKKKKQYHDLLYFQ